MEQGCQIAFALFLDRLFKLLIDPIVVARRIDTAVDANQFGETSYTVMVCERTDDTGDMEMPDGHSQSR